MDSPSPLSQRPTRSEWPVSSGRHTPNERFDPRHRHGVPYRSSATKRSPARGACLRIGG